MHQQPLAKEYIDVSADELYNRIESAKKILKNKLVILGHHYQRDEIIYHADFTGDSYKLAKDAAATEAEYIVFCGVHFMAESADILTRENQKVILPNLAAGCSMADMANLFQVRNCWSQLKELNSKIVPITYINSAANLKAFVGENGGTVCTSTNAPQIVSWALTQGEKILFFPDQHLGRNTGIKLGFDADVDMCVWDFTKPYGGNTLEKLQKSKFILWRGHCSVHQRFNIEQINSAREKYPDVKVLVHPECDISVVNASDYNGSTEYIIKTIESSPSGSIWAVGTEINLVSRLSKKHTDKTIFCLDSQICPCSTMYRIHPSFLCWVLEELVKGNIVNQVVVSEKIKQYALIALNKMLSTVG